LKSILSVDDSKLMRMANEKALIPAGYGVAVAGDGEEASGMAPSVAHDEQSDSLIETMDKILGGETEETTALSPTAWVSGPAWESEL